MSPNIMTMHQGDMRPSPGDLLELLSPKEREVLDLVAERHTTKEIARHLGLSPNTVDTRLAKARDKLGVADRNSLARAYMELTQSCGKTTSGSSPMFFPLSSPLATPPEPSSARFTLRDAASFSLPAPWERSEPRELPEVLDKRYGKAWRVVAVPLGALSIALLALAVMAISQMLGTLI